MNWIKLDGKKEPPFDTKMIIALAGEEFNYVSVYLEKIETMSHGKEYIFRCMDNEYTDATHYCIPTEPKK